MCTQNVKIMNTTTSAPPSGKGKRRAEFSESQRFKGKTFFLDLSGYKRVKEVEQELCSRGATIQNFLDKKVRYLITNKSKDLINKGTLSSQSPHTSTPSTGGTSTSQFISPQQFVSPSSDVKGGPQRYYTRTQRIAQMAKQRQSSKEVDVLKMAAGWKCKILHIKELEKQLKRLPPLHIRAGSSDKGTVGRLSPSVRKLRRPFFKVEDLTRQYRPVIYEPSRWPTPDIDKCTPHTSPFLQSKARRSSKGKDGRAMDDKHYGYCEPCCTRFVDLAAHLQSSQHQQYAVNPDNFCKLDEIISQCPSLEEFVSDVKQRISSRTEPGSEAMHKPGSPIPPPPPPPEPMCDVTPPRDDTDTRPDVTPSHAYGIKYSPRLMVTKVLPLSQEGRMIRRCGKDQLPTGIFPVSPIINNGTNGRGIKRQSSSLECLEAKKQT